MQHQSAWAIAFTGLAALAVAVGIGRFAFTPILPMMLGGGELSVPQGSLLASANYLGYLLGALAAIRLRLRPATAVRAGLLLIALTTISMAYERSFTGWLALRLVAGIASAWVLVFVSTWALDQLASLGREGLGGVVYAGVGAGILAAGAACLVLVGVDASARAAWLVLGIAALAATVLLWTRVAAGAGTALPAAAPAGATGRTLADFWELVLCYGAFGFGYIIPATFLPLMAKQVVPDAALFGWAWPVFGVAAIASTVSASWASRLAGQRSVWILANIVMAAGLLAPIVMPGLIAILLAAVCVGGTFMVMTMVGLQEARRLAGANARVLIAAMTAAFAAGQIAGPLAAGSLAGVGDGFSLSLVVAAASLLLSACVLYMTRGGARSP